MRLLIAALFLSAVSFSVQTEAPDGFLKVRVSTWNVAEKTPPSDFDEFLGFQGEETPDILAVGLQEVTMRADKVIISAFVGDKWTKRLDAAASARGLKKVKYVGLVGLALNIYVKDEYAGKVQKISSEIVKTGFLGTVGNKGAVAVRLRLLGRSYLFINSHLPAHDDYNNARIEHANFIWDEVTEKCITLQDYVFWFGDLNFRLDDPSLSAQEILDHINQDDLSTLLNKDQLKHAMKQDLAFSGFSEMEINFKPTFKFHAGTTDYKLKRRPAWTDRVLYRAKDHEEVEIRPLTYKSLESQTVSDHRPVVAEFYVKV